MSSADLSATQMRALLQELAHRMGLRGVKGDIKLVGGAALILQGVGNRPTPDIDAVYADKATIDAIVTEMAADYDIAPEWLNSNASAFVPDNASWITLEQIGGLTIEAADTKTLLAMKIAAERDKDITDIARLLSKLKITDADEAVDVAFEKYGEDSIPLAASRENYLIVVNDALGAAESINRVPDE